MTAQLCPDCRAERPAGSAACPSCGLPLAGPVATELGRVDRELADLAARLVNLDQERSRLFSRRGELISRRSELIKALRSAAQAALRPRPAAPAQPGGSVGVLREAAPMPATAVREAAARLQPAVQAGEASGHSIQTVLLLLGGLLLAVAAIAFTVFAWGRFGIPGRAIILAGLTIVMLTVPALLVRKRLAATGETIAAVGLVLVALDGYAAWRVGLFNVDNAMEPVTYAGVVAAVLTAVAALYPLAVPLRLPRPIAVLTGQFVLPLLAVELRPDWLPFGTSFALVAAADLVVVWWARRRHATPELVVASLCAALTGVIAGVSGVVELWSDAWRGDGGLVGVGPAVLLAGVGALGLVAAELADRGAARQLAAAAALLAVAMGGYGVHVGSTTGLELTGLASLVLLAAVVAVVTPARWRVGALSGATLATLAGLLVPAFWTVAALAGPLDSLDRPWSVGSLTGPARLVPSADFVPDGEVALAFALVTAAVAVLIWRAFGRAVLAYVGVVAAAMAALVVPAAVGANLGVALLTQLVVAVAFGAGALAARKARFARLLTGLGLLLGAHAACWSVINQPATLASLGALTVAWVGLAAGWARPGDRRAARTWLGGGTAAAALLALTSESGAVAHALDATRLEAALAVFGAAALAVGVAVLLRHRLPGYALAAAATVPISVAAGVAVGAGDTGRPGIALLLALAGALVLAAASAVRTPADSAAPAGTVLGAIGLFAQGIAVLALLPVLVEAVFGPLTWAGKLWDGAPARSGAGLGIDFGWSGDALDVITLLILGAGAMLIPGLSRRGRVLTLAPCWALAVLLIPLALDAPWPVGVATAGLLALAGAAAAALATDRRQAAIGATVAGLLGSTTLGWSLASRPATIVVLAVALAAAGTVALLGRTIATRLTATVVGGLAALAEAGVVGNAAGLGRLTCAYPVLAVAAALAGGAAVLRFRRPEQAFALEGLGVTGGLVAVALTSGDTWYTALTLTLSGVAVGLTALRRDRRRAAYVALGLEVAASWLWLATAGIRTPEAYTLPAALLGLAAGLLALRRKPELSSWTALAPGLLAAFLPSLALVFGAPAPLRSLLLGLAALGTLLAGAATRRQAPFALGSVVLALVALRVIWPLLPWVVSSVPTWLPLSLGGLLLIAIGATYEQRRNDVRRARHAVARMN
jgi:hypothetical protein